MKSFLKSADEQFFELSPLLKEVYVAISIAARPLHAKEIVALIEKKNGPDFWAASKTPEKTINARLSEHIKESQNQVFFRTGPNLFYHRPINDSARFDSQYEENWHLPREKKITDEFVMVAPKHELKELVYGDFVPIEEVPLDKLSHDFCYFMPRTEAEDDYSVKQFVSYSIVRSKSKLLIYRRGLWSNPSGNLFRKWSVAFGGHVSESDLTLFDKFEDSFLNNSIREVNEELNLLNSDIHLSTKSTDFEPRLLGFINTDDNSDARQHIAAVVELELEIHSIPRSVEHEITQLQWIGIDELKALRGNFDLWSRLLIDWITDGKSSTDAGERQA